MSSQTPDVESLLNPSVDLTLASSTAYGVQITSAAAVDSFGSWVELSADIGVDTRLLGVSLIVEDAGTSRSYEVEIGEGASGSESAVLTLIGRFHRATDVGVAKASEYFSVRKRLTNNARLSARVRDDSAVGLNYRVNLSIFNP